MKSRAALLILGMFLHAQAFALTTSWTNAAGGNWSIPGNWSQGVPGVNDTAAIQLNGTYTVTVNVAVDIEAVLLGAASGVQTLLVSHPFDCGQSTVACSVGVNGFLDVGALLTTSTSATVGLINYGMIYLRVDDGVIDMDVSRMYNYSGGTIVLEGLCEIRKVTELRNFGSVISLGAESIIDGDVANLTGASFISVGNYLGTRNIYNEGLIQITQDSDLRLDSLASGAAASFANQPAGILELYPGSTLRGTTSSGGETAALNWGTVTVIDTIAVNSWATVRVPFEQYGTDGLLNLLSGKLELLDTAFIDDSVHVAAGATLKLHGTLIAGSTRTSGSGEIEFAGDAANQVGTAAYVRGTWGFTGDVTVSACNSFPTTVDFIADGGPAIVSLRRAKLANEMARFVAPKIPSVTVESDTIVHSAGTLNGLVEPQDLYHWSGGTLTADSGTDFVVPPGALLLIDSSTTKTLDSIALVVEGIADLSGSGPLVLEDSARLATQPTASMLVQSGFEISGSGDFYNSGQTTFDATPDTILVDVFATNTTMSRTPGTIDVLSGKVVLSRGGVNKGTITIHEGATLIIYGTFVNEANGTIQGTGTLDVTGANFTNNGTISPGLSPGRFTVLGDVSLGPESVCWIELAGPIAGEQHDQLLGNGIMQLGGTLNLQFLNGYVPAANATFPLITYAGITDSFAAITGTSIGNGQFLEFDFGPSGMSGFVCDGVSNLTVPAAISDTMWQASAPIDTLEFDILNSGECPLTFSITVGALTPPSPVWLSVVPSSEGSPTQPLRAARLVRKALHVNVTGGTTGTYTGSITIHSNDPDDSLHVVPITLVVIHGPDVWDIGGGSNDFANFNQAVNYLDSATISHPQIFNVYAGIYDESITLSPVAGATAANTVTFRKEAGHIVKVQSADSQVLRFNGADHFIWDGIDITHLGMGAGSAIVDTAGADSNVVRNCTLTNAQTAAQTQGVFVRSASGPTTTNDYNRFENLTIQGFTTAVLLGSATGIVPSQTGNEVSNCVIENCGSGIIAGCQAKAVLERATISLSHPFVSTVKGIEIGQLNSGDTVRVNDNEIHDLTGTLAFGIYVATFNGNSMVWVYNNRISSWNAAVCQAIVVREAARAGVHYNSLYMNEGPAATYYHGIAGGETANITATNNIIFSDATSDTTIAIGFGSLVTMTSNHNCFYGTGSRYVVGRITSTNYSSLAAWQTTGRDANSLFDDPGFASTSDLHIDGYYTTCDVQGLPVVGITTDMDGQSRDPLTPDIGADEFTGLSGPVTGLVARRIPASTDVRLNWNHLAGAARYLVYASTSLTTLNPIQGIYLGNTTTNTFDDIGAVAQPNLRYFYFVRASTLP